MNNQKTPQTSKSPGHQGAKSGGTNENERVLWCSNLDLSYNYQKLHDLVKDFGAVERIKMTPQSGITYNAYVTFYKRDSALDAHKELSTSEQNGRQIPTRLLSVNNIQDEECDYIRKVTLESGVKK